MIRTFPSHTVNLVAAETLQAFDAAVRAAAVAILGSVQIGECAFLALHEPDLRYGLIVNRESLQRDRFCRPHRFGEPLMAALSGREDAVELDDRLSDLIDGGTHEAANPAQAVKTLLLPLRNPEKTWGAWVLELEAASAGAGPSPEQKAELAALAAVAGSIFGRVFHHQLGEEQRAQTQQMHEAMLKVFSASNREDLLSRLLGIMMRHFGMERVSIALIHPHTNGLRSEMHTGFASNYVPFAGGGERPRDFFEWASEQNAALIYDQASGPMPKELPLCESKSEPARAILAPMRVGTRPIGLIYADQANHDGRPIFAETLDLLSRLAGIAIENLNVRAGAEQRAETDPLTGLRNRFFLDRVLEMEIPRVKRYNQPISLLMIDLCDFKQTNDTYGHQFGDYILKETAHLLQANVRSPDFVIRFGGDEFLVLMVNTSAAQAELVRDRVEAAFVERNRYQTDRKMMIRISIGLRSADSGNIEGLIYDADMAMYAQKARQKRLQLIQALLEGRSEPVEATDKVVGSLCNMLYKKAPYYADHARRVAHLALIVARRLGLPADQIETLTLAALLHDVGKVSLPTEIIQKSGTLTSSEKQAIRHHAALGEEFFVGIEYLEPLRPLIRSHHERFDGVMSGEFPGYPDGLAGEGIPLGARILKLAESVDALFFGRSYRPAVETETALDIIRRESGRSFDPRLARVLLEDADWQPGLGTMAAIMDLIGAEQP